MSASNDPTDYCGHLYTEKDFRAVTMYGSGKCCICRRPIGLGIHCVAHNLHEDTEHDKQAFG